MQEVKVLKVRVGGSLALSLERAVASEGVTAAEIMRRGLLVYLQGVAVGSSLPEGPEGPAEGPQGGNFGPSAAPPSSPPPSSPPAPPLTPPSVSPPASLAPEPPPRLLFPCLADRRGEGGTPQWPLTEALVAQWEETFPGMDVIGEARKAREWLLANHLKTYGGMRTYLFRWFCRAQNSGRFMRRTAPAGGAAGSAPGAEGRSLEEVYGFASWSEWETTLRKFFAGAELDRELANLGRLRARWEETRDV